MVRPYDFVVELKDIDIDDKHHVGEPAANLGSMVGKFPVPDGFVVSFPSYFEFLKHNNLDLKINHLIGAINFDLHESINQVASHVRKLIRSSKIPDNIVKAIMNSYEKIGNPKVLVRTSIITGDLDQNAFEREYTSHHVHGDSSLVDVIRSSWASIFTPELIFHRHKNHIDHLKTSTSAFVIRLADPITSGRILTADPHLNDGSKVIIQIPSDYFEFLVDRIGLSIQRRAKKILEQPQVIIKNTSFVSPNICDYEIIALAKLGIEIEKHFYFPLVIEWVKEKDSIYVFNVTKLDSYGKN